jgi:Fe-S-cluster formation regulator IscX/YfhJ
MKAERPEMSENTFPNERADPALMECVARLSLVDHHVHGPYRSEVTRLELETMLTEGASVAPGLTQFDSQVGFAIRRWCAPELGLERHASADEYVARRLELGNEEVNRRLLSASGVGHFLNDTGALADELLDSAEVREISGARVDEIVRLEWLAVELIREGVTSREFPSRFRAKVAEQTVDAVGMKSIVAYLNGFEFDPSRPRDSEVIAAASPWIDDAEKALATDGLYGAFATLMDPVLHRFFLWTAIDRGLPLQLHTGYGSLPIDMLRANPLSLRDWLELIQPTGVSIMLIHCYPYHREAGYLAQIFTNVYIDVGLAINYTGVQSEQIIAESLELAPFGKVLYSSDAWGPAELHFLGAALWRQGMVRILSRWTQGDDWSVRDAMRISELIGRDNARRVYQLD